MSETTLRAMLFVIMGFAAMIALRAVYVMALYRDWSMSELLGFSDGGWETERMRRNRRSFWR